MVARAVPEVWKRATVAEVLQVRQEVAVTALRRAGVSAAAAGVTGPMVASLTYDGRALAAAHAALPRPGDPLAALWWDCTVLRELRGDGHVAALVVAGLDGCAANVLMRGLGVVPERQQEVRGWSDQQWSVARERLRLRGLLDANGFATDAGRALREEVERMTDATVAHVAVSDDVLPALVEAAQAVALSGAVPYPNPVGVPRAG